MNRLGRVTGVAVVAALLATVLFLSLPGPELWRKVLQDAAHGPVFAVIAVVMALMARPSVPPGLRSPGQLAKAFALAVLFGAAAEIVQHFMPDRSMSLADLAHDAAGAAGGLGVLAAVERRGRGAMGRGGLAVALAMLVVLARDPATCALAYARRAADFPVLARAASASNLYFLRGEQASVARAALPEAYRRAGDAPAFKVDIRPGPASGLQVFEPAHDWRGYRAVAVDLTNPGVEPLPLVLRIVDATTDWATWDRLNQVLTVPPRTRLTVRVPLDAVERAPRGRRMNLAAIADVMLFVPRPTQGRTFYVSRIWLETGGAAAGSVPL